MRVIYLSDGEINKICGLDELVSGLQMYAGNPAHAMSDTELETWLSTILELGEGLNANRFWSGRIGENAVCLIDVRLILGLISENDMAPFFKAHDLLSTVARMTMGDDTSDDFDLDNADTLGRLIHEAQAITGCLPDKEEVRTCRVCGCTDDTACVTEGVACHWVSDDLCSACVTERKSERRAFPMPIDFKDRRVTLDRRGTGIDEDDHSNDTPSSRFHKRRDTLLKAALGQADDIPETDPENIYGSDSMRQSIEKDRK